MNLTGKPEDQSNPYKTLTLHYKDINTIQAALGVARMFKASKEEADAIQELASCISLQTTGGAPIERIISRSIRQPGGGSTFTHYHYDCFNLTNIQYADMGGATGTGKPGEYWQDTMQHDGEGKIVSLWFQPKETVDYNKVCDECGKLIHTSITEG